MAERPHELHVTLAGLRVATLTESSPGRIACRYTRDALARWPGNTPLLSCSLPLSSRPSDATAFLEGLLPEGEARALIAADRRVAASDTWMLLAHLGRDVAGAVSIHTDDAALDRTPGVDVYDHDGLERAVAELPRSPLDLHDDSELSLAGLQNKMALVELPDGRWGRPVGGAPSTHIRKVEDRRYPGLATFEAAALRLARMLGLTTVEIDVVELAGMDCLVVSRFDRTTRGDGTVVRIHQEDLCQACGYDPSVNRRGKYERHGGPGFVHAAEVLRRWGGAVEREQLLRAMVFTVGIGNADAHAKNLAFLHPSPGELELAPLYDTVPTVLFDQLPRRLAMTVNAAFEDITAVTFQELATEPVGRRRWGLAQARATELVVETLEALRRAAGTDEVPDELATAVTARCDELLAQAASFSGTEVR